MHHERGAHESRLRHVKALVNGVEREVADDITLAELLRQLGVQRNGVAVAVNDRVVHRAAYEQTRLSEGDRIEIITAVGGG